MKKLLALLLSGWLSLSAYADPQLTSWLTNYSGQYARVYTSTTRRSNGNSDTTWTNQSTVVYSDIAQILYSANSVYIRYPDLPSYVMGPWLNPQGAVGSLWPSNQKNIAKFPRTPSVPSKKGATGTGYSGNWVNGTAVFNSLDGKAWNGSSLVSSPHTRYTNYWHQNAPVAEDYNFDYGMGHQNPAGVYHTHQNPLGLRYQLGDHVSYNSSTKVYSESTNTTYSHSPILGYAYDGYPIYGPYGYGSASNATSAVRRMVAGYVKRDGTTSGVDSVSTNLNVIPLWSARYRTNHFFGQGETTLQTTIGTNRPSISSTYPLGNFAEDWAYLGDITNASTGQVYVKGTDFDLDEYNGRYCYTPEYPTGTYAYFVTIDSSGNATYPYTLGFEFFGNATGTNDTTISEAVTTNFAGASDFALKQSYPSINTSNYLVTLVWSSTEGGTYTVESSTNSVNWTVQRTNVAAAVGVSSTTNYTSTVSNGVAYVRLTRTAIAANDSVGGASGVVGQTNVITFTFNNTAPTVNGSLTNQSVTYGGAFSYTFQTNAFLESDTNQSLTYTASSPVLTNSSISFDSSTRTFSATAVSATSGTIASNYTISVIATDNGSPAKSATNTFTLTINKTTASVTPAAVSRGYGRTNPVFTGTLTGFVSADSITGTYTTSATTNSNVGTYAITPTLNDAGSRLGNYTVTTNAASLTITQAVLTVIASNYTRGYGATNPTLNVSYSGFTNGQTLATSGVTGSPSVTSVTTNSNVGNYTITNALGSLAATNYSFTLVNGSLTVTQALMSVTTSNASRAYGVTNPVLTASLSGLVNSDNITVAGATAATTNSPVGSYTISPSFSDPGSKLGNYSITTNTGSLTISKATLLASADAKSRAYGTTNPTFTVTYTGFANNENAASAGITGSATLTNSATTNTVPGTYVITNGVGTLSATNYSFTATNGTLTITKAALSVTASNLSRAYGSTNPVFGGTLTGVVNNENITAAYTCTATTNNGTGVYTITATLSDPGNRLTNYTTTTNNGTLTVTQAVLSVTATNLSRTYGSANPVFGGTLSGVMNNENITASYACAATTNSSAGTYAITATLSDPGNRLTNYIATTNNGTLTVTPAVLTITPDLAYRAYGATNPVFTYSYSGFVNSQTLATSDVTGAPSLTCDATTNSTFPAPYVIVVSQGTLAATNYSFSYGISFLTITAAVVTVTVDSPTRAYGSTNPPFTVNYSGFVNGQTFATSGTTGSVALACDATASSAVGTYTITNSISNLYAPHYTFNLSNGTLTVTQAVLTVSANSFSRAYGATNPVFTGTLSGVVNSDNITASYTSPATTTSAVGSYAITPLLSDPDTRLVNYLVTTNVGALTITNASGTSNYTVSVTSTNALVALGVAGTNNYTFVDPASGESVTVRLVMTAYSASNASPVFTPLDTYGNVGQAVHMGVESYQGGGDGNFTQPFEGANFTATLNANSSGVASNTVKFCITGVGFRFGPQIAWNSSAGSTNMSISDETIYPFDTTTVSIAGTNYSATLRSSYDGSYQWSDLVNPEQKGLLLTASFLVGTVQSGSSATLGSPTYDSGQFSFTVSGTTGASYIVQATTDLNTWVPVSTNTAPFTYTVNGAGGYTNRFYRVVSQ